MTKEELRKARQFAKAATALILSLDLDPLTIQAAAEQVHLMAIRTATRTEGPEYWPPAMLERILDPQGYIKAGIDPRQSLINGLYSLARVNALQGPY